MRGDLMGAPPRAPCRGCGLHVLQRREEGPHGFISYRSAGLRGFSTRHPFLLLAQLCGTPAVPMSWSQRWAPAPHPLCYGHDPPRRAHHEAHGKQTPESPVA
jgi:hypothetical protein